MNRLVIFVALMIPVAAGATGDPPVTLREMLAQAMSRGAITYPAYKGQWQLILAPAYVKAQDSRKGLSNDLNGYGFTAAATYGLSRHWTAGFMAGYAKVRGPRTFGISPADSNGYHAPLATTKLGTAPGGYDRGAGVMTFMSAIWDHWTGDNFRLPVTMGVGYLSLEENADNPSIGLKHYGEVRSPAVAVGAAPAFNLGRLFRLTSYLIVVQPLNAGEGHIVDYNPSNGVENRRLDYSRDSAPMETMVPIFGIDLTYRPWGLGFSYIPAIEGATAYSLKWTHRWGPKSADDVKDRPTP